MSFFGFNTWWHLWVSVFQESTGGLRRAGCVPFKLRKPGLNSPLGIFRTSILISDTLSKESRRCCPRAVVSLQTQISFWPCNFPGFCELSVCLQETHDFYLVLQGNSYFGVLSILAFISSCLSHPCLCTQRCRLLITMFHVVQSSGPWNIPVDGRSPQDGVALPPW